MKNTTKVDNTDYEGFGERLALFIEDRKKTAFAKKIGTTPWMVTKYLKHGAIPAGDTLHKISVQIGKSMEWLMTGMGKDTTIAIPQDILDILEGKHESLKRDLILYAQKLKEREAEIEEQREIKATLDELKQQLGPKKETEKNSHSQTGDPEETDADLGGPETGTWGF